MSSLLLFLFGLLIGSFLNVVISRLPLGQSVVTPRSHCPDCGRFIRWYDNIPLVSFLILGGQCRACRKPISWRYPLVELLTGLFSLLVYWKFNNLFFYLLYFPLLVCPLIAITFIDLKHRIIPNVISIPGIGVGIFVSLMILGPSPATLLRSVYGILAGGGSLFLVGWMYEKLRRQEGIGMGDVKLAAMLGAFFGWKGIFVILLLGSLFGSLVGLFLLLLFRKNLQYAIPFGPFLAAGAALYLFWGPELVSFYLREMQNLY